GRCPCAQQNRFHRQVVEAREPNSTPQRGCGRSAFWWRSRWRPRPSSYATRRRISRPHVVQHTAAGVPHTPIAVFEVITEAGIVIEPPERGAREQQILAPLRDRGL